MVFANPPTAGHKYLGKPSFKQQHRLRQRRFSSLWWTLQSPILYYIHPTAEIVFTGQLADATIVEVCKYLERNVGGL